MEKLLNSKKILFLGTILIFIVSIFLRLITFNQEGGDHITYKTAVLEFLNGENPYEYTVRSYQVYDLRHGYAYMPTLLYVQSFFVWLDGTLDLDWLTIHMWKVPVLLADIAVGWLIFKILKQDDRPNHVVFAGLIFWFFNPYFFMRFEYTHYETLPVFFLLLSLMTIGKKDFWSGILYALAVSLKTFPIILFGTMLIKSKNYKKFLLGGFFTALIISLPFFKSFHDFSLMIVGSLLVHGERGIQGRPLLSMATLLLQNFGLSLYQAEYSKIYSLLALGGSFAIPVYLYFRKKVENIWVLILSSFTVYFLLAPVFNRTHSIWVLPFIFLGLLNIFKNNYKKFYLSLAAWYLIMCPYYYFWLKGLKSPEVFGGKIWLDSTKDDPKKINMFHQLYLKALKIKNQI